MKIFRYNIHIDSMLRLTEMGIDIDKNAQVEVMNIEGLDEAICLVNKACSLELNRRQKSHEEEFARNQFLKLKECIDMGLSADLVRDIMQETMEFYKDKKSCLEE